jgi:hypothetical protein
MSVLVWARACIYFITNSVHFSLMESDRRNACPIPGISFTRQIWGAAAIGQVEVIVNSKKGLSCMFWQTDVYGRQRGF